MSQTILCGLNRLVFLLSKQNDLRSDTLRSSLRITSVVCSASNCTGNGGVQAATARSKVGGRDQGHLEGVKGALAPWRLRRVVSIVDSRMSRDVSVANQPILQSET